MKKPLKFALVISATRNTDDIVLTMKTMFNKYPDVPVQIVDFSSEIDIIGHGLGFGMNTNSDVLVKFNKDEIPDFDWQTELTERIENDGEPIIKTSYCDAFVLEPIARQLVANQIN